jgi:tetraacyldisaccharide 4'-kinase
MSLSTPRWWYLRGRRAGTLLRLVLTPASWIWAAATARRIAGGRKLDPGVPVICIGNLTLGGAGKTPVAAAVLGALAARGVKAHALSRGHGGRLEGPVQVDPALHTAREVGDEPLMLASLAPAWIARDRAAGAQAAAAAGAQAVVMDDGHQNASVLKALSLVVVDGETRDGEWPFSDGQVFPAGPMREPLKAGLARADAVVILLPADLEAPDPELCALLASRPILIARLEPLAAPPAGPQLAFAGVGKPWKVERALKAAGCELVEFVALPDHAPLDEDLLQRLSGRAGDFGAGLITTEKDWVRLPPAWRGRVAAWPVRARFEDPAALQRLLDQVLASARQPMSER